MIRAGTAFDLPRVALIQESSPEAAQWPVPDYLQYSFAVAEREGVVAGFAVWRGVGEGEWELLNIAVDERFRRLGVGRELLGALPPGRVFIEVRESNAAARALYHNVGFTVLGKRREYYYSPNEDGIVMELQK
ncbi:MAG: GNAT family N-acetyltransferase [Bryobacteraceae bacterium]